MNDVGPRTGPPEEPLAAWHARQVGAHLERLMAIQAQRGSGSSDSQRRTPRIGCS
jgi:hypothetical protein